MIPVILYNARMCARSAARGIAKSRDQPVEDTLRCGVMGDRIGPRRVLTRIVLWWSVFTSITGAVSNFTLLLITRFCFGMGEAGAYPNIGVAIARWFPLSARTSAWGIVLMFAQLGGA